MDIGNVSMIHPLVRFLGRQKDITSIITDLGSQ